MNCRIWIEAAKTVLEVAPCLEDEFRIHGYAEEAQLLKEAIRKSQIVLKNARLLSENDYECPDNVDELVNIARFFLAKGENKSFEDLGRTWTARRVNPPNLNVGP